MNDEELTNLIARCALKDQKALHQLYQQLSPWLNAVAYRILKSPELSNDALQEAFVQIWNHAASYRPDKARPLTWICSILRYRALDRLEKERKHLQREVTDDDLHAADKHPGTDEPEGLVQRAQVSGHIAACMQGLNERIAACLKLAYLYGYSREEISARYATPVNTVKSWLRRGSEQLKLCLESKL